MALSFTVSPGYQFSASEKVTYSKLNLLGSPVITLDGQAESSEIADGSITTAKLASTVDINSKIADHNIQLAKLASGTHGQVLYYDANGDLVTLNPGTSGNFLKTNGAGADPEWAAQAGVSTINVSQINAGSNGDHIVTTGGVAAWQADTRQQAKVHDTVGTGTFSASTSWASDGVVITATPTQASTATAWSSWRTGLDPSVILASPSDLDNGFTTDFTINSTTINAAYSTGISAFDSDVNELLVAVELYPVESSYIALGVYDGTNYVPIITKFTHLVGSKDRTEWNRDLIRIPRLESNQIRLQWIMHEGYASGAGDKAYFEIIGHR